ncbi:TPA: hypothetical protein N0F65_006023 [Lagenidium giganteum]|uniref:GAG-pre-integrase domain-containing protein n=1 Tax=Lagenidium giganteum TaxID=4803 RepID=A0AAV2Z7L2_9STRA|nr:TPA: hypothetical protein N0F65_006023 [Lagenidium giganteum]
MIRDQGYEVYYDNDAGSFELVRNGTVMLRAHDVNRLWPFTAHNRFLRRSPTIVNYVVANATSQKEMNYWHNALGHINTRFIRDMANQGLVVGMKVVTWDWTDCETCHLLKQIHNVHRRASCTNDLIFADLMDFSANKTMKFRYLLVIVNAFSNFTSVFLLQKKSETNHCLEEYISWAEIQQGRPIKQVLTKAPSHTFGPQAPQSNPCERTTCTLLSLRKSILKHSGLPLKMWTEAALMATNLKNRVRSKRVGARKPNEAWYKAKPSVRYLRPFGSLGYAYVHRTMRTKLDDTAMIGYRFGFSNASTGYKVFFPDTNVVKFAPVVRFYPTLRYRDHHNDEGVNIEHWLSDDVEEMDDVVHQSENNLIGQNIRRRDDKTSEATGMVFMP